MLSKFCRIAFFLLPVLAFAKSDNSFDILSGTIGNRLTNFSFIFDNSNPDNYSIGNNGDWGYSVTSGFDDYDGTIDVMADRHGSSTVMEWVSKSFIARGIPLDSGHLITYTGDVSADVPEELNFAIIGNLLISSEKEDFTCNNIIIAQGHNSIHNNWYIFSNDNSNNKFSGIMTIKCISSLTSVETDLGVRPVAQALMNIYWPK